jgi:hypothetical protein
MAAGDPGTRKRNYSATAIETKLLASIASAAQGDTTTGVLVNSISGFPTTFPYTLILDPDTSKEEVVTVTSGSSTTLVITRGQDNTTAFAHAAGTAVRHGVSAREFKELQTHISARGYDTDSAILSGVDTHVHGLVSGDGSVVGSDQSVTLTRKTLTTPTINGATITGTVTASTATLASPTITSPTISGSPVITGLSSAGMSTSSAAPKSYVDALITTNAAYATAAATSATSAATSATSAATSASSALTSQTAAATSATSAAGSATAAATSAASAAASTSAAAVSASSAATSASSAATSATAAATSAASALTSQTAAATSATSAAASATAAATSATSAAASATAAGTSATSAAASASSAAASVATIAGYATTASNSASAAATSASSAATSAASAAASTSAAAASASAAATSATSASASQTAAATSATSAATSASSALTSQTAAATSATSAATSASSALTSQTAAATSATSAATSATSSAASYTTFQTQYLGAKASAPTVDNQGGVLITGASYWNSTNNALYVWSGSVWVQTANTSSYTAPTLGSQTIASGTTYTNINGLTLNSTTIPTSKTLVATDSTAYVVPSQTGNSGKYLTTDGTTSSWGTVTSYSAPTLGSTSIASGATVTTIAGLTLTNPAINNFALGYSTTVTAAGTTTLTNSSNNQQLFTGTTTQTVVMPVASTMTLGTRYLIENNSTGNITVNSSGSNLIATVLPGTSIKITCILTSGTTAASWDYEFVGFGTVTGTGSAVLATSPSIASPTLTGTLTAGGGVGTNGQVLQSTGSGISWATPASGGAYTLLASGSTVTNLTISSIPSGYTDLILDMNGISTNGSYYGSMTMQLNGYTAPTYYYAYQVMLFQLGSGTVQSGYYYSSLQNSMYLGSIRNGTPSNNQRARFTFPNYSNGAGYVKAVNFEANFDGSYPTTVGYCRTYQAGTNNIGAITSIKLQGQGNGGTYKLYGVK